MKQNQSPQTIAGVFGLIVIAVVLIAAATLNYGRPYAMYELYVTITSDATSASTQDIATAYIPERGSATQINGKLYSAVTVPGTGASSPTAGWDLIVVDVDGYDVLRGGCADRYSTSVQGVVLDPPTPITGALQLRATNMGGTRTATLRLRFGP